MKIGIIQATTQSGKNELIFQSTQKAVSKYGYEVVNFGTKPGESISYSYPEIAFLIALLIDSRAVDFVVTGCSSGQGMNLACNALPGLMSGLIQTPQDAFLYGRINGGNVASLSLGLGFGWMGELNLEYTLEKLFDGDFGIGYPSESALRKKKDMQQVRHFNSIGKRRLTDVIRDLDADFLSKALSKDDVVQYILQNSQDKNWIDVLSNKK